MNAIKRIWNALTTVLVVHQKAALVAMSAWPQIRWQCPLVQVVITLPLSTPPSSQDLKEKSAASFSPLLVSDLANLRPK